MSSTPQATRLLPFVRIESDLPGAAEGHSATRSIIFAVVLAEAATNTVRVSFATSNGSATAGQDYQARTGTLAFLAGETRKTFAVSVTGDTIVENDETFYTELVSVTGPAVMHMDRSFVMAAILNDDGLELPTIRFSTDTFVIHEGFGSACNLIFSVMLSSATTAAVRVNFETSNGSANRETDYEFRSGHLLFQPGETQKKFAVKIFGDTTFEQDERFYVDISHVSGPARIDHGRNSAVGVVLNDDTTTLPFVRMQAATVSRAEGDSNVRSVAFTAELSFAALALVQVNFSTINGSAKAGSDYVAREGVVNFQPGQTSRTIGAQINGDATFEADETFYFELSVVRGPAILDPSRMATLAVIANDDLPEATSAATSDIW